MVTAPPIPPSISADVTTGTVPLVVNFTGSEPATYEVNYIEWDYGDTSHDYATWTPTHVYNVPGVYDVNLYVENILSFASTTESSYITVTDGGPLPATDFIVNDASVNCLEQITFTDLTTNYPTTWNWNFGDTETSTLQNPVHSYEQPGTYTVSLEAANWNGSDTETKTGYITITMAPYAPVVAFSATPLTYATLPTSVTFTDESTNGPTSWQWNFGDGYISTDQNPTHNYTISGSYTVTLTATNTYGDGTLTKTNYITVGDYSSTLTKIKVKRALTSTWESATTPHYLDGGELGYDKTVKQLRIGNSETESVAFASCDLIAGGSSYTAGYGIDITDDEISVDTNEVATPGWVASQGYITGIAHNDTTSIQGGTTNEYYHLDADTYNTVATTGDIPTYTGGTGIDVSGTVISVDPTEAAVLPVVWVESRYLKSTAVEGTLEWATAGGTGAEYSPGYGIDIAEYIITTDSTEVASLPPAWESSKFLLSTGTEGTFEWATTFVPQVTKVLYVDKNRTDSYTPDGSIDKPFLTIGAATAIATDGTAILVYSGTYTENVVLPIGVSLEGFEENGIVIAGTLATTNGGTGVILKGLTVNGDVTIDTYCSLYDVYITGKVSLTDTLKLYAWHLYLNTTESGVAAFTVTGNATVYLDFSFISSTGDAPAIDQSAGTINVTNSIIQALRASDPVVDVTSSGVFRAYDSTITNISTGSSIDVSDSSATSSYPHIISNVIATGDIVCYVSYVIVNSLNFTSGSISGSYIIYDPASRLDNDSSVSGDTIKDALETLAAATGAPYTEGYGILIADHEVSVDTTVVATQGDIPTYTGGTGIDIAGTVISVDSTEAAVLPETWVSSRYLKSTASEGVLEWATAGGTGSEYTPGYGIDIADYVISADTNEMASVGWVTAQTYMQSVSDDTLPSLGGDLNADNHKITSLASPETTYDAANKGYVDQVALGLAWQEPVLDIVTFANLPPTPDLGDRYIVEDDNDIAVWQSPGQWYFYAPATGWAAWVTDDTILPSNDQGYFVYNGALVSSFKWVSIGSTITHANLAGLQGGAAGQYYHLDADTYNTVATTGDIPTYTAGYGIDIVANEISVDTLEVATVGVIIPGVSSSVYGDAIIQTDNPSPRRSQEGEIYVYTTPTYAGITWYKTANLYTLVTAETIVISDDDNNNDLEIGSTGISLTTNSNTYDFYNENNLDINWFASIPLPWESGKYLKSTAVEGTLEWATAGGSGGGIEDVPNDGNNYVRTYGDWVQLGTLIFSTNDDNVTLPASPSVGDAYEMVGTGSAWTVTANTGQYIRLVTTESGAQGVASGATGFECASFIYIGAVGGHNTWLIRSAAGTIGVV